MLLTIVSKNKKKNQLPPCDRIAFIDDDEFIVIESGSIKEFLEGKEASGIVLNWSVFGEGKAGDKLQMERYTRCIPPGNPETFNRYIKTIVKPETVNYFRDPHFPIYFSRLWRRYKRKQNYRKYNF